MGRSTAGSSFRRWGSARPALPRGRSRSSERALRPGERQELPVTTMNHLSYQCGPDYVKVRDCTWIFRRVDVVGQRQAVRDRVRRSEEAGGDLHPLGDGRREANDRPLRVRDSEHHDAHQRHEGRDGALGLKNIRPDGEHGWISDDPAGYMLNTWVPEKDAAMFPGAARPCAKADSKECKDAFEAGLKGLDKLPKASGKGSRRLLHQHRPERAGVHGPEGTRLLSRSARDEGDSRDAAEGT